MHIRGLLAALAVAGALLVMSAAPAFASGPPLPARCGPGSSWTPGELTCVTQTTMDVSVPPGTYGPSHVFEGGFTAAMFCGFAGVVFFNGADTVIAVTSTTTTVTHGMNGRVISANSTPTSLRQVAGVPAICVAP